MQYIKLELTRDRLYDQKPYRKKHNASSLGLLPGPITMETDNSVTRKYGDALLLSTAGSRYFPLSVYGVSNILKNAQTLTVYFSLYPTDVF